MYRTMRCALLILACLASPLSARSQFVHGEYRVANWTVEDGLPSHVVRALAQTPDGALWVGTWGGLARFDGQHFETYDLTNAPELGGPEIAALHVDRDGVLWIGASSGALSTWSDGRFRSISTGVMPLIRDLAEDRSGAIWIGGSGLACFADGAFRDVPQLGCWDLLVDDHDELWAANLGGVHRLEDGAWSRVLSGQRVSRAPGGVLGHLRRELWSWEREAGLSERIGLPPQGIGWVLDDALVDRAGDHWWAAETGLFRVPPAAFDEPESLSAVEPVLPRERTFEVRAVLEAPNGDIWFGTERRGLFRLQPSLGGLVSGQQATLVPLADGSLWTAHGPSVVRSRDGQVLERVEGAPGQSSISPARGGGLWIASPGRLFLYRDGLLQPQDLPPELSGNRGRTGQVFEDRTGRLWWRNVALQDGRVVRSIPGQWIGETTDGSVWFDAGPQLIRLQGDEQSALTKPETMGGQLRCVHRDGDGRFWFSSYGSGLWCLDGDGESFGQLTTANGLPSNLVGGILEDRQRRLWISSNRGVVVATLDDLAHCLSGDDERLRCRLVTDDEMSYLPPMSGADGRLHLSTTEGYIALDPERLEPLPASPQALVQRVESGSLAFAPSRRLELPLGARSLRIVYSAPYLADERNLRFTYELQGTDEGWVEAGSQRVAAFSGLAPGEYVFRVAALTPRREDLAPSPPMTLVIPAHYHETAWFRWVVGLTGAALIYAVLHVRLVTLRRKSLSLAAEVSRRTQAEDTVRRVGRKLIGAQEDESRRIARELHDDIGQRLALLTIGLESLGDPQAARPLVEQTQSIARDLQHISRALHPGRLRQLGLARALRSLGREVEQQGRLEVAFEDDVGRSIDDATALGVYRIAQESLANAVRHSGARSVRMAVVATDRGLTLTVSDDGCGFDPETAGRESLGLSTMEERASSLGGVARVRSSPGAGTVVEVRVPLEPAP